MGAPYFQASWGEFEWQGVAYPLHHLDEFIFAVEDSAGITRKIIVSFGDHCFTRMPEPNDDPALIFPESDRGPGVFCTERYALSLGLPAHIKKLGDIRESVWIASGDNYAIVPTVDLAGQWTLYAILFSLDPITGLPAKLHMRVITAYPITQDEFTTFGDIRFRHLVKLRLQRTQPTRILSANRRRPRLRM